MGDVLEDLRDMVDVLLVDDLHAEATVTRAAIAEIERLRAAQVGVNVGVGEAPADGQRVVLCGEVVGRCSISPPPWISVRLDDGRIVAIDAPFKSLRIVGVNVGVGGSGETQSADTSSA